MAQGKRAGLSAAHRTEVWCRWKAGQSLHMIGRAFGKPHTSIHCLLSHHGGIVPAARRRSLLVLTAAEREDISRGLASGSSIRDIAKRGARSLCCSLLAHLAAMLATTQHRAAPAACGN